MSSIQPFQFEPELTKKENPTNTLDQVKENTTNMPDQEEDRMEDEERVGKKYSVLEELLAKAKREPRESQERECLLHAAPLPVSSYSRWVSGSNAANLD